MTIVFEFDSFTECPFRKKVYPFGDTDYWETKCTMREDKKCKPDDCDLLCGVEVVVEYTGDDDETQD